MNNFDAWDRSLFLKINAGPAAPEALLNTAVIIATDAIYVIPLMLVAMWLWGDEKKRELALSACAVAFVSLGLNQIIGLAWQHPRPFAVGLSRAWLAQVADSSFPSDHMTVFAGIGITLLLGGEMTLGILTLVLGFLVAWSRIYLGLHFPLDMLGAVIVACLAYAAVSPFWRRMGPAATRIVGKLYGKVFAYPIARGWVRR
jgi:undecaprenyl-diphosphatase